MLSIQESDPSAQISELVFCTLTRSCFRMATVRGGFRSILSNGTILKNAVLERVRLGNPVLRPLMFSRYESVSSARIEEHGFESTTISDILKGKGKSNDGSWLWCTTDDSVNDAVKSMTQHNVGALVVVKPGEQNAVARIITERDYLRKIIVQGRSSKSTKVGDIMTEEVLVRVQNTKN
ncbi:Cystathionine beta-synthase (CBS) family protein [Heracleum sosnowskyi]|uniref:Cystathionine beta-synthase (CBS) family protein n=1 Tax=Heracleum sosnowskyi TaxID=360622 RepID=A0AAD8MRJ1_9APIA|nr:Cystathionine beta-synthase (CBS) family protein [Heracleum sosnowskyi]